MKERMPYSFPNNVPQWASKKSDAVQKVAVEVFNSTYRDTKSEEKAMRASQAAMANAEESFKKKVSKSVEDYVVDILKAKYQKQS